MQCPQYCHDFLRIPHFMIQHHSTNEINIEKWSNGFSTYHILCGISITILQRYPVFVPRKNMHTNEGRTDKELNLSAQGEVGDD